MLHSGDLAAKVLIGNGLAIGRRIILGPLVANTNYLVVSVVGVIKQLLNYLGIVKSISWIEVQSEIGGRRVKRATRMDGVKFIFADGSWLLMCPSGTEPLVRSLRRIRISKKLGGAS